MTQPPSQHLPVMPSEVVHWLKPRKGATLVDGTLGGGGHARLLAERVGEGGLVIGLDRDSAALAVAAERLRGLPIKIAQANFAELELVLAEVGVPRVDGILLDLGLSSDQLADDQRGFSFGADGPLDLRFDPSAGEPASTLVNRLREKELADLIFAFGEERHSRRIARAIAARRRQRRVETSRDLAEIVRSVVSRRGSKIDPATRTFQALRIAVNDELGSLDTALDRLPNFLNPAGRLAIISFHSLEDRRVKQAFRGDDRYEVLTRRPIRPSDEEIANNPRARSARMRVAARSEI